MNSHYGKQFHCGFCGKPFKSKEFLEYHEKEHQGLFKFRCRFCEKGFNHHGNFVKHEKSHVRQASWKLLLYFCCPFKFVGDKNTTSNDFKDVDQSVADYRETSRWTSCLVPSARLETLLDTLLVSVNFNAFCLDQKLMKIRQNGNFCLLNGNFSCALCNKSPCRPYVDPLIRRFQTMFQSENGFQSVIVTNNKLTSTNFCQLR